MYIFKFCLPNSRLASQLLRGIITMAPRKAKRQKLDPAMLDDDTLILICDWAQCRQLFQNLEEFISHVAEHAGSVEVTQKDDNKAHITCLWEDCGFETTDQKEVNNIIKRSLLFLHLNIIFSLIHRW